MRKTLFRTVICLLLALTMVLGLAGCGDKDKTPETPAVTQYTVTFDVQGHGTAPQTQTVDKGGKATEPTAPTAEGWIFGGWYKEAGCTNKYDFATETVTANITLYAKWTAVPADKWTVTFDVQGHGTAPQTQTVDKGGKATEPTAPTAEGWIFGGWYKEAGCTNKYDFATETVTANITLYAKWTKKDVGGNPLDGLATDCTPTIYLAGDSTVQSYSDAQYIAGWGQYLGLFLDSEIKVVNAARGGRSSRSFINEDRLFTNTDGKKYPFTENGGKSIEETIQKGDFLFIQFGHNDDASKVDVSYMYDRMVPLGEPDANGIYPVTAPAEQKPTTYLPQYFLEHATESQKNTALNELAKYGDTYYAYGDGTYKWYLKQFIELAREKEAIPVLMTPVARVSFNADGTLKSGAGLHGEDFAYVKAVRQLAEEENCLLIDNFDYTKRTLETATKDFADFLMAIVPNQINNGPWPSGYDNAYKNADAGYDKMEGTHYNKYGAYLTAAYIADSIINANIAGTLKGSESAKEYFNFASNVLTTPSSYIEPSNRISISKVAELEEMFVNVNPTDPNRTYKQPSEAIKAIEDLQARGPISSITSENYKQWKVYCEEARAVYESLNFDYRKDVTNYDVLLAYEEAVKAARPKPAMTVVLNASDFVDASTPITVSDHTFSFHSTIIEYAKRGAAFTYNDVQYGATTKAIRLPGNSSLTGNQQRYIEFTVTGACTVTMVASGGGSTTDVEFRYIQMVDADKKAICEWAFGPEQDVISNEIKSAGTYRIGSKGSNIDLYYIIIEYYNEEEHQHSWATEWSKDANNHWYDCLGCDAKDGLEPHTFDGNSCTTCGYVKQGGSENPPQEDGLVSIEAFDHTQNGSRVTQLTQKLFKVGDTFNYNNLSVKATSRVNGVLTTANVDMSQVTVVAPDMTTAGEKTVLVQYGGKETSYIINVIDLSGVNKNQATVTVDPSAQIKAEGNAVTVKSVNDAVRVYKLLGTDDNTTKEINLVAGTHHEKVEFDIPNLYVKGATSNAGDTIIEFDLIAAYICPGTTAAYSTDGSATVSIREKAIGFHAENITFQNYWNTHERYLQSKAIADKLDGNTMAVACLVQADRCVFDNVRFSSYHDTLYDYNGRHVYNNCYMEGRTDYVFGYGATSLFNNCTLKTIGANDSRNGGYVIATMGYAKYTPKDQTPTTVIDYGYIFNGCTFTNDNAVQDGTVSLARAWSDYMTLAFINCNMSSAYSKTPYGTKTDGKNERYGAMTSGEPNAERLYEYGNTGAGALDYDTLGAGKVENLCTVLTEAQKNNFLDKSVIFGAVNGQIEYSSAWNGEAGVTVPTIYSFKVYDAQSMTDTNGTPVSLFDGAMTLNGKYRLCGASSADGSIQLFAGSVFKLNVQGKVTIEWYPGYGTTAVNAKINYKNGYATITIIGTGSDPSTDNQYYIKWIEVDGTQQGVHAHEYGEWNVTSVPTTSTVGSASRTCMNCELETAHVQTVALPVLSEENYTLGASANAGKAVYTYHSEYGDITFEADALAGVHVHHYGAWEVKEENKPTEEKTGLVTRTCTDADCNHDDTSTESKVLPVLTDKAYTITDDTATVESGGTGTYTITIEGIDEPVSFTATTPRLTTTTFNFGELPSVTGTTYTEENPAKPFGENKLSIVGTFRQQSGTGIEIKAGSVITLHMQGTISIVWFGSPYGTAANGKVTYKNGYATLTIIADSTGGSASGIYIKSITVDHTTPHEDTKYTVTFNSKGGSAVESKAVLAFEKVEKPQDPTFEGYTFLGWYKEDACLQEFDFETEVITEDITLYAKWKSDTVENRTVTIKVWNEVVGTIPVEDGTDLTAETVEALLATKGYDYCHAELYTDEALTTPLTEAITEDTDVHVKVVFDMDGTINLLEYDGAQVQNGVAYWHGIKIDATTGKFGVPNNNWCQFNQGTVLNFYVGKNMTATINQYRNTITFEVDENGLATITASGDDYISSFTLKTIIVFNFGDSVDLVDCGVKLQGASGKGEYKGLSIDATGGKFYDNGSSSNYVQVNANTIISFKVAEGITAENMKVVFVAYNDNENIYQVVTHFTLTVEDGVATITVNDTMYIKGIKIVANNA